MTQGDIMLFARQMGCKSRIGGGGGSASGYWLPRACLVVDSITSAWSSAELVLQ